jgi:HD-GYP domain-containing protein (c-di-GMP phosphodiesterase class II)
MTEDNEIYKKFFDLSNQVPIPIVVSDFKKKIFVNNEAKNLIKKLFGSVDKFAEEITAFSGLYKKIFEDNGITDIYHQVGSSGEAVRNIFITISKGLEQDVIMLMNVSLITGFGQGKPIGFLTTFENLTEIFNFNRELHYSMANLKGVIEAFARDRVAYLLAYGEEETVRHLIEVRTFSELIADAIMKDSTILNKNILEYAKITPLYTRMLGLAAMLHDFGKIEPEIHDLIIKPRNLTDEEYTIIKKHPRLGADLIGYDNEVLKMCWLVALYHHERWDGTGYPEGLKERDIPLAARIVSFADMYSALKNKRAYKEPVENMKQLEEYLKNNKSAFDPVVFETGMRLLPEMEMRSVKIEEEYKNFQMTSEEAVKLITDVFNSIMNNRKSPVI